MKSTFFAVFVLGICAAAIAADKLLTVTVPLSATVPGSEVSGLVTFTETATGVEVSAKIIGASPGKHGFHIHENGSCADEGKAAGGHFNPNKVSHGLLEKDGHQSAHAGDMGNITIDANGNGQYKGELMGASLSQGIYNIAGKSVILHQNEDDFSQPTGNAGGRIGCGVIEVSQ